MAGQGLGSPVWAESAAHLRHVIADLRARLAALARCSNIAYEFARGRWAALWRGCRTETTIVSIDSATIVPYRWN
jgi:hypothetical protein